jgi:uracil-DNA glycosylase family protein
MREVVFEPTLEGWRRAARRLIAERVAPEEVSWREAAEPMPGLFEEVDASPLRVPRAFLDLASAAAASRDPTRWSALYRVLWRVAQGERDLFSAQDDPDVAQMRALALRASDAAGVAAGTEAFVPKTSDLGELRAAAASCRGCDLYRHATQTVFGAGPATAAVVFVGEQPGDQEDLKGAPFVGPAGEVFDRALAEAGIPRQEVYVTNAVKHFKFERRGTRRIHKNPNASEIAACRPWLEAELALIRPKVLVCLGATASKALLGPQFRLLKERGRFLKTPWAPKLLATYHPSAALRAEDEAGKEKIYQTLLTDLKLVAGALEAA